MNNISSDVIPFAARHPRREDGAAMVIALVMLLVLTLLATASARMTLMEERMTGNTQDRNIAFQAAEAALRAGEDEAQVPVLPNFDVNTNGLYTPADPDDEPIWKTVDWTDADQVLFSSDLDDAPGLLADATASYIVEELPRPPTLCSDCEVDDANFYRVTARGVGVSGNATVTLQTTYKR